jgi:Na+/melibiose symporter-like transporter
VTSPTASTSRSPFAVRDFRLLWVGEAISSLGDQFALIALPWLALVLTGSPLALGGALALMAVPRALLMIVGGVSVDRFSPRLVMLGSNAVRLVAVTTIGLVVLAGAAQLWMLYAFALVFGVADAFFFPAQTSIVPELVEGEQLQRANGIVQGTAQATVLVGPAVAGVVIAALGAGSSGASDGGIGVALLIDAATFLASLVTLWLIRPRAHTAQAHGSILEAIREGVRFVWRSPGLRAVIVLNLAGNLFIVGPFEVGMPFIAYSRLPEGAAAFGLVMAAFGGGSLLGLLVASILPAPRPSRLGPVVMATLAIAGLGVAAVAQVHTTILAILVIGAAGTALGAGNLLGLTWIQGRIPPELMGRVMSLLITASVGLVPVSMLVAGVAVQVSLDATMLVAGLGMAVLALGALLSPAIRNLGLESLGAAEPAATA